MKKTIKKEAINKMKTYQLAKYATLLKPPASLATRSMNGPVLFDEAPTWKEAPSTVARPVAKARKVS